MSEMVQRPHSFSPRDLCGDPTAPGDSLDAYRLVSLLYKQKKACGSVFGKGNGGLSDFGNNRTIQDYTTSLSLGQSK